MTSVLITSVTGTRSWMRAERKLERFGTQMERKRNANGTQMEREWNANGTHLRARSGRVPNAFSVRLFLSSTVRYPLQRLVALIQITRCHLRMGSKNNVV